MKVYKTCPICSKPFNPCRVNISTTGTFNWRSVVCSFECGKKYLEKIDSQMSKDDSNNSQKFADMVMNDIEKLETVIVQEESDDKIEPQGKKSVKRAVKDSKG